MKCINCGTVFDSEQCPCCGLTQKYNKVLYRYEERQREKDMVGHSSKRRKKKQPVYRAWWFWAVIGLFVIGLVGMLFGGREESANADAKTGADIASTTLSKEEIAGKTAVVDYTDLLRNPDDYKGEYVVVTAKLSQVMEAVGGSYYFGWTDEGGYGLYFDDQYCFVDKRANDETKLLDDDILTVYGQFVELRTFERSLTGQSVEVPVIDMFYVDIIDETTDATEGMKVERTMAASEPGVFETDTFKVTYVSHSLVTDSRDGSSYLDVVFEFEHYGDSPISYNAKAFCQGFQEGIELEKTVYDNGECEEIYTEVMADTPIRVNDTFQLKNTEDAVYIEVTELISYGGDSLEMTLELK